MASKKITAKVTPKSGGGKIGTLKNSEARKMGRQSKKVGKKIAKNLPKTAKRLQYEGRIKRAIKEYEKLGYSLSDEQRKSLLNKRPKTADKAREAVRRSLKEEVKNSIGISPKWIKTNIFGGNFTQDEYYLFRRTGMIDEPQWSTPMSYDEIMEFLKNAEEDYGLEGTDLITNNKLMRDLKIKVSRMTTKKIPSIKKGK